MEKEKTTKENELEKKNEVLNGMLESISVYVTGLTNFLKEKGLTEESKKYLDNFYDNMKKSNSSLHKVEITFIGDEDEGGRNA